MLKPKGDKNHSRSEVCLFIRYPKRTRECLFYSHQDRKVIINTHFTSFKEQYMNNFKPESTTLLEELSGDYVNAKISIPVI